MVDVSTPVLTAIELFGRYVHAANRGTLDEVMDCFDDDARLDTSTRAFDGREAIAAFYRTTLIDGLRPRCRAMRHKVTSPSAHPEPDDGGIVRATCYFDVDAHVADEQHDFWGLAVGADSIVHNAGRYDAEINTSGDPARFRRLVIHSEWVAARPRIQPADHA